MMRVGYIFFRKILQAKRTIKLLVYMCCRRIVLYHICKGDIVCLYIRDPYIIFHLEYMVMIPGCPGLFVLPLSTFLENQHAIQGHSVSSIVILEYMIYM